MLKIVLSFFFLLLVSLPSVAQETNINNLLKEDKTLTKINLLLDEKKPIDMATLNAYKSEVLAMIDALRADKQTAESNLAEVEKRLDALGAVEEGKETKDVANKRKLIEKEEIAAKSKIAEISFLYTKAEQIQSKLNAMLSEKIFNRLTTRISSPLNLNVIKEAFPQMKQAVLAIIDMPEKWYSSLSPLQKENVAPIPFFSIIAIVLFVMLLIRKIILKRFGRRADIEEPSQGQKLVATLAYSFTNGLLPALVLGISILWIKNPETSFHGDIAQIVEVILMSATFAVFSITFSQMIFAPYTPKWQLIRMPKAYAIFINRKVIMLTIVFCLHVITIYVMRKVNAGQEALVFLTALFAIIEALIILRLLRHKLWKLVAHSDSDTSGNARLAKIVRITLKVLTIMGLVAALLGYVGFADYVLPRLIISAFFIAFFFILQDITMLMVGVLSSPKEDTSKGVIDEKTLVALAMFFRIFLYPALVVLTILILLPVWGVPINDIFRFLRDSFSEITVGGVSISLKNIILSLFVFIFLLMLFSALRKLFETKIMANTSIDPSVQQSLSSGAVYIGFIVALIAAVVTMGVDFTNIAILAGALSVGIGFGLQNVVNNFVSGIIILIERPIKIGDWILVGNNEGIVKKIRIRATELETWKKATVIIPNADIISSVLTNVTLRNLQGRTEIALTIPKDSDVDYIKKVLLECCQDVKNVQKNPQPYVIFTGISDTGLQVQLRCFVTNVNMRETTTSLVIENVIKAFQREGLNFAVPKIIIKEPSEIQQSS